MYNTKQIVKMMYNISVSRLIQNRSLAAYLRPISKWMSISNVKLFRSRKQQCRKRQCRLFAYIKVNDEVRFPVIDLIGFDYWLKADFPIPQLSLSYSY